jgi:hypothetical protein
MEKDDEELKIQENKEDEEIDTNIANELKLSELYDYFK